MHICENSEEEDEPELRLATIEIYGHSPKPIDVNVDIMSYWEEKKFTYPRLYRLAKPAEEDITEEIECSELPELDGYVSDASTITRDLSALCTTADQEVILGVASDDEDANQTVVEVISSDVP
ncbi:hypothetical protein ACLKA7_005102 [Drosophila subpalustris]